MRSLYVVALAAAALTGCAADALKDVCKSSPVFCDSKSSLAEAKPDAPEAKPEPKKGKAKKAPAPAAEAVKPAGETKAAEDRPPVPLVK